LYISYIQKPVNLLFCIDHFVFEFSKRSYQQKKTGDFLHQLKERKKLSFFYGDLTRKQISSILQTSLKSKGLHSKNVFSLLERRLDVVLYRSGLIPTIIQARQLIKHKKITVNQNTINIPSFRLNPGDIISINRETGTVLSNELYKSVHPQSVNSNPKTFGILEKFVAELQKTDDGAEQFEKNKFFSSSRDFSKIDIVSKQSIFSKTNGHIESKKKHAVDFKLVCKSLILLLCGRIQRRCFFNLKKHLLVSSSIKNIVANRLDYTDDEIFDKSKISKAFIQKNVLLLKWKKVQKFKKNYSLRDNKLSAPNSNIKWKTPLSPLDGPFYFDKNGTQLQKKPVLWYRNNTVLFPDRFGLSNDLSSSSRERGHISSKNQEKIYFETLRKYRNFFRRWFKYLETHTRYKKFIVLSIKQFFWTVSIGAEQFEKNKFFSSSRDFSKSIFQKSFQKTRILSRKDNNKNFLYINCPFRSTKPIHLEISYKLLNIIYLYPPQRLNFPFYIDGDLISRSLR
jgi:ribosomal protein S4